MGQRPIFGVERLRPEAEELTDQDVRLKTDKEIESPDEADLVDRLRCGDSAAFAELVDSYAELLLRVAIRLTGSRSDAEDIVQETFEGALKSLSRFEGRASMKSWLISILYRRAARLHKKRIRFRFWESDEFRSQTRDEPRSLGHAGTTLDIETILGSLSPEHKAVVVLREVEGLSYQEISDALEIPRGTVESRLFRARQTLRQEFREFLDPSLDTDTEDNSGGDSQ